MTTKSGSLGGCPSRKFRPHGLGNMEGIGASFIVMFALLHLLLALVFDRFKSRRRLEIENLYLRHQLNIAMRRVPQRLRLCGADRTFMVWMTRRANRYS